MILPLALGSILCGTLYPPFIAYLKRQPWRREVREDVPQSHSLKSGTPSMGGGLFLVVTLAILGLAAIFRPDRSSSADGRLLILALTLVLFGLIGFIDDYSKATRNRGGITARTKLALQLGASLILVLAALRASYLDTKIAIPFMKESPEAGWFYVPLAIIFLVITCNAANLNDGMDGLCTGLSLIALATLSVFAFQIGKPEILIFCSALGGALIGFLIYNAHPARVFMGDTGSQALGGSVAMAALLLKIEVLLPLICLPWLLETLSVMIQVSFFKLTKRLTGTGKRVFPMTPIHHAFELSGWSEWKVCALFWVVGGITAAIAVLVSGDL